MIEEKYQRQLAAIAERAPDDGCVLLLVPTMDIDLAAALSNDLAQLVGRTAKGHTLLFSFESSPSVLDHEIGVEQDDGVTDILAGRTTVARAAAHGRARGFVYIPAGRHARADAELLRSAAWRSISGSAAARGATVLAFVPRARFYPLVREATGGGAERARPRIDGVVWLGPEPSNLPRDFGVEVLGALEPPGRVEAAAPEVDAATAAAAIIAEGESRGIRMTRRKTPQPPKPKLATVVAVLIVLFLAAMGWAAFRMMGPGQSRSLLPGNDALWLRPLVRDAERAADSSAAGPTSDSTASGPTGDSAAPGPTGDSAASGSVPFEGAHDEDR